MARRNIKIDLRLNESEAAMLNRDVEKSGLSREAYLRALIKHMPIKEKPPIEFTQMLKAMQQISNNMNQIDTEYGDQLLTLSTCEYTYKNGRLVVVAKKVG